MPTPEGLEREHTLATAVARFDELRTRESMAATAAELSADDPAATDPIDAPPLRREEALELLSLGEVIARKAGYGRQLSVRAARAAGASWAQIGEALGTTKQSAWEAHSRWIDAQEEQRRRANYLGWDDGEVTAARRLAGSPDDAGPAE